MNNVYNVQGGVGITPVGLIPPTNQICGFQEMGTMWTAFRVVGLRYRITFCNNFSAPIWVFVYPLKPTEGLPTSFQVVREGRGNPGWRERLIASNNGGGKTTISGRVSLTKMWGSKWQNLGDQAFGRTPLGVTGSITLGTFAYTGGAAPTITSFPYLVYGSYGLTNNNMNANSCLIKAEITFITEFTKKGFEFQ